MAIDQSGDLFVADDIAGGIRISRIEIQPDGSAGDVSAFATVPTGGTAADIEFDAIGTLFVADNEDEVWIITIGSDGSVTEISPFASGLVDPFALVFESSGDLFVGGASGSGDIWRIDPDGNVDLFATDIASAEGLAFDDLGNLFVSESRAGRIIKIAPYIQVSIDIKPGGDPNSINCNNENGVISVAILTTEDFDATAVDHTTVTFEGASETHVDRMSGEPRRHEEDVDYDGDSDLVLHFRLGNTDLTCDSKEGTLIGETYDGQAIQGTDAVRMIDQGGGQP